MVYDSDELSSKIFTAFPSFQESHSSVTPSQLKEDLWRAVTLVVTKKQILKNLSGDESQLHSYLWSSQSLWRIHMQVQDFLSAYMCVCVLILVFSALAEMRSLQCSCVILLSSWSVLWGPTHYLLPSEQLDKIHLMGCQEVCFFSFLRSSCQVLSFSNNQSCPCTMISRSLSGMQTQQGDTGQQLPMSGNRRAATSALVSLTGMVCLLVTLQPPLLVTLQPSHLNVYCFLPTTKVLLIYDVGS